MSSLLEKGAGVFDPTRRFAFTNITDEDFVSAWGGQQIVIKPGHTVELPHHLANKFLDEMVDKIMIGDVAAEEHRVKGDGTDFSKAYYRSPKGNQLGVPAARKVWEDKICQELEVDQNSTEMQLLGIKLREELVEDLKAQPSHGPIQMPGSINEFADLTPNANAAITHSGSPAQAPAAAPVDVKPVDPAKVTPKKTAAKKVAAQ